MKVIPLFYLLEPMKTLILSFGTNENLILFLVFSFKFSFQGLLVFQWQYFDIHSFRVKKVKRNCITSPLFRLDLIPDIHILAAVGRSLRRWRYESQDLPVSSPHCLYRVL